jgi:hypothetical protein
MRIEYLLEGAAECPLVRLFGTDLRAFVELREICRHLGDYSGRTSKLVEPNFDLVNLDEFNLSNMGTKGVGRQGNAINWTLAQPDWHLVSMLIEPFVTSTVAGESFQWLAGAEAMEPLNSDGISILLSHSIDGSW